MNSKVGADKRLSYYLETPKAVIAELHSHAEGITNPEAARRLDENGYNSIVSLSDSGGLVPLRYHLTTWQSLALFATIALTWHALGNVAGLIAALFAIGIIATNIWREQNGGSFAYHIDQLLPARAVVMRSSVEKVVDRRELVIGDVVVLRQGDIVPADLRLLAERHFTTDDSQLTGSNEIVHKYSHPLAHEVPAAQRQNIALMGTKVLSGRARGIVIATGIHTEIGRIANLAYSTPRRWSLTQMTIERLSPGWLAICAGVAAVTWTLVPRGYVSGEMAWAVTAIAAVAATLGGFTLGSAILGWRARSQARRRGVDFQRTSALTNLAATDVALLDEAGFVTTGAKAVTEFRVGKRVYNPTGGGYEPNGDIKRDNGRVVGQKTLGDMGLFFEAAALTSRASLLRPDAEHNDWHVAGPHADGLLLALAHKAGINHTELHLSYPEMAHHKFDSARQRTSVVHRYDHRAMVFVRGAAEAVLQECDNLWDGGHTHKLGKNERQELADYYREMERTGHQVVLLAYKSLPGKATDKLTMKQTEHGLTLLGSVAIDSPLAAEAKAKLTNLVHTGIRLSLISPRPVAQAIALAAKVGFDYSAVIDGHQIHQSDDNQLVEALREGALFVHLNPEDRLRLVDIARYHDLRIAVSGNGLQGVPALRHAHVGIADESAHASVIDEANLVLVGNDLSGLNAAVIASRNHVRALRTALSVSLGDGLTKLCFTLLGVAAFVLWHAPLGFTALFAIALIALSPLGIASLSHYSRKRTSTSRPEDFRSLPVRPSASFAKGFFAAVFATFAYFIYFGSQSLSPGYIALESVFTLHAATVVFAALVLLQLVNTWFDAPKIVRQDPEKYVPWFAGVLGVAALLIYLPPVQEVIHTQPLGIADWAAASLAAVSFIVIRWAIRREQRQTRHSIIEFHHEVHGHGSSPKV